MTGMAHRSAAVRILAVSAVAFLSACTSLGPRATREYVPDQAQRVFAKAYENVFDKYIEPLDSSDFALRGIKGLASFDERLSVSRNGNIIHIALAGGEIARFAAPPGDDVDGWARLTTRVIDATRPLSDRLRAANAEDIYKAVLNDALADLDRHSRYAGLRSARDYRAQREGFGGVGIRLNFDHGLPEIISVLPDTHAESSDLKAGDVVLKVDGVALDDLDRDEIIWYLRGEVGSLATLMVRRKSVPDPITITLRRSLIVSETVHLKLDGKIAVITLSGFNQRTARNLNRVLDRVNKAKPRPQGIVLDMRGNPGGLLDQAVAVADSFLGRGRIVSTRGRHPDSYQIFNASGRDIVTRLPVVALINGQSASAAEIVAAALQDQGRAVIVGSNSYGKGTVQNITRLPNDGELILTWSRFHAPSGYALENLGVMPNFCTARLGSSPHGALQRHALDNGIVLAAWRAHSGYDAESATTLRQRCPKTSEKPARDLELAAEVLGDPTLYARAVGASVPALARRRPGNGASR